MEVCVQFALVMLLHISMVSVASRDSFTGLMGKIDHV